jgi:hypothetical protein
MVSCEFFSTIFFVSSKWTQCNKFLINFITLHWTTLLVRIQLHSSSTPNWVLWVHILLWKVCNNSSQYPLPFINQVLNTIAGHDAYSFLDGYFGYTIIQIQNNLCNKSKNFYLGSDAFWSEKWTSCLPKGNLSRTFKDYLNKFVKIFLDDFNIYNDMGTHLNKLKLWI